jgi:copper chaperone NosL
MVDHPLFVGYADIQKARRLMRTYTLLLLAILMFAVSNGCGREVNTEAPPRIVYGQDVCDRCNMIISEERYAAAYWNEAGEARRFDDIGGMLAHIEEHGEKAVSFWVHDFETAEWIRAEEATFVVDSDLITPMGFGIVAFSDGGLAQSMAKDNEFVMVYSFTDLQAMEITMPMGHNHDPKEAEPMVGEGDMNEMEDGEGS